MYDVKLIENNLKLVNNSLEENEVLSEVRNSLYAIDPSLLEKTNAIKMLSNSNYNSFYATQQIESIDYSEFKNHVFFDSAVNKVNFVLNKILNFPYDKGEVEYNNFIDSLEGYMNYVYKNLFPKYKGMLKFSGNEKLMIKNQTGSFLERKNNDKIGQLMPSKRFSFNFWLKIDSEGFQNNQVVFKLFNNNSASGLICFVEEVNSQYYLNFLIINKNKYLSKKIKVVLDTFENITINVTSENNKKNISFLVNGNRVNASQTSVEVLPDEDFDASLSTVNTRLVLGGSENLSVNTDQEYIFTNFKGSLDDFRYFNKIRSAKQVKNDMHSSIFAQNNLICYLKFNEPGGSYTNACVCLDYSGNKLHGVLFTHQDALVSDTTSNKINVDTPLKLERELLSPVRNAKFPGLIDLHQSLMTSAESYDKTNSNLIFKLMPKHYFLQSADLQQLPIFSNTNYLKSSSDGIENYQSANNHLVNIVLIWAKFFDQLKLYTDSISNIVDVDYDTINDDRILGVKIPLICKLYGLDFAEIFGSSTKRKNSDEALNFEDIISDISIRKIQNQIWYKILINSKSILSSKGTINSIEQILSLLGADNLENISIKEHTANNDLTNFNNKFNKSKKIVNTVSFLSKNLIDVSTEFENNDFSSFSINKPFIQIENIKSSADILGKNNFIVNSEDVSNGLGRNFSIEYYFDFEKNINFQQQKFNNIQNLFRLDLEKSPVINCYFYKESNESNLYTLNIDIKPVRNSYRLNKSLTIKDIDIFSRESYICLTQNVTDNNTIIYNLYYSKANEDHIADQILSTEVQIPASADNILSLCSNQDQLSLNTGEYFYDNTTTQLFALDQTVFEGNISCIRTWSKGLSLIEINNHTKNIFNISESSIEKTCLVNNFIINSTDELQELTENNIKKLNIENQSLSRIDNSATHFNQCYFSTKSSSFLLENNIVYKEVFVYNKNFDLDNNVIDNKVNIISYSNDANKAKSNNYKEYPSFAVESSYNHEKSNKLSVDFSIAKNINNDINRILLSLDDFSNILNNNAMYEYEYVSLNNLKKMYFSRLSDDQTINYSSLLNVFRYLDNLMTSLIYNIIPSKTSFKGFNFVYESHILERNKYQHKNGDSRLSVNSKEESKSFSREFESVFRDRQYNNNRLMR